jgi:pimeloyl-ACP methyl ester carboxylesterase
MKTVIMKSIGLYLNTLALVNPEKAGKKGLEIFCYPMRPALSAKQKDFLEPAKDETIEYKGTTVQTYKWGQGPTKVLFLHGWQSHTYRWKRYIESFDKNEYTVYALDAPGHGLSDGSQLSVPLYSEVISEYLYRLGNVHALICHSIGGFSALYTYFKSRDVLAPNLILLAPPGEADEFFQFYKKSLGLSSRAQQLIVDQFQSAFGYAPEFFSAPLFASAVKANGLIIHDEDDKETSVAHARRISANWQAAKLQITKGLGHNLKSDDVVNTVVEFVAASKKRIHYQNQLINQL